MLNKCKSCYTRRKEFEYWLDSVCTDRYLLIRPKYWYLITRYLWIFSILFSISSGIPVRFGTVHKITETCIETVFKSIVRQKKRTFADLWSCKIVCSSYMKCPWCSSDKKPEIKKWWLRITSNDLIIKNHTGIRATIVPKTSRRSVPRSQILSLTFVCLSFRETLDRQSCNPLILFHSCHARWL